MEILLPFIIEHWAALSAVIAAIGLRLFPTEKNYDIFSKILRILDLIVPNIKKGGGRHITKIVLFFVLAFVSVNSYAQLNTRTRQIRFATGVQAAADTAETAANAGRIWYDFVTGRYRANFDGVNGFFGEGGGGGNYWPLDNVNTGPVYLSNGGTMIHDNGGDNFVLMGDMGDMLGGFAAYADYLELRGGVSGLSLWGGTGSTTSNILLNNGDAVFTAQDDFQFETNLGDVLVTTPQGTVKYYADLKALYTDRSLADWGTILGAKTFTGKQTFVSGTAAAINFAEGTPSGAITDGDMWFNTSDVLNIRQAGSNFGVMTIDAAVSNSIPYQSGTRIGQHDSEAQFAYNATTNTLSVDKVILNTAATVGTSDAALIRNTSTGAVESRTDFLNGSMVANSIAYGLDANTLTQNSDITVSTSGAGSYILDIETVHIGRPYVSQNLSAVTTGIANDLDSPEIGLNIYNVEGNASNPVPDNLTIYAGSGYSGGNHAGGDLHLVSGNGSGTGVNGNVYISSTGGVTTGTAGGWIVLQGLPTSSPCATAPAGTLWSNAGVLTVCP